MKPLKPSLCLAGLMSLCLLSFRPFSFGAGYEFEGIGAKQVSMAGAAIATSNDWTAIYWNPANMAEAAQKIGTQFGLELFGGEANGKDSNSLSSLAVPGASYSKDNLHSNFILGALGFIRPLGSSWAVGGGFYTPLLQGASFTDTTGTSPINLDNSATILTWTTTLGYTPHHFFSLGAGINVLYGRLASDVTVDNFGVPGNTVNNQTAGDGLGLEGIFGASVHPMEKLRLGAVYRTGSDVELKGDATVTHTLFPGSNEKSDFSYMLRHPATWGVGVGYQATQTLLVSLDYDRTLWHRFTSDVHYDTPGTLLINAPNGYNWQDTTKIHLGADWAMNEKTHLYAGYSRDQAALDGNSVDFATSIDVPMKRYSVGVSRKWSDRSETILGALSGSGKRTEGNVTYKLSGYQIMLEQRLAFLKS